MPVLNRRSFFAQVTGSTLLAAGALRTILGKSYAEDAPVRSCLTDTDGTDLPDFGRQTGLTDFDTADAEGRGTLVGRTDADTADIENRGRSWRCAGRVPNARFTGRTDSDSELEGDRAGFGRTGVTDTDSGVGADRPEYGRGSRRSTGITDSDPNDPAQGGRGGSPRPQSTTVGSASTTPPFPRWPPPRASARQELERSRLRGAANLGEVADRLMAALTRVGNPRASYYTVPGGFALVARLERIRDDARPFAGAGRFVAPRQSATEQNDPLDFVEALFFAPRGHYRQVMFVVADLAFSESAWTLTAEQAASLLDKGSADLDANYRDRRFGDTHRIWALIYEFRKQGDDRPVVQLPGRWSASLHLRRSGLLAQLPVRD